MEEMNDKNENKEEYVAEDAAMTEDRFDELKNLNWLRIPDFPYIMKYKFVEDGYMLIVSDLAAVYGEKLDESAILKRFQRFNPHATMLPKVILKHLKQTVQKSLAHEQASKESKLKITLDYSKFIIQHQFLVCGVCFIFNLEPEILSGDQFKAHFLKPTLLRALVLYEEKADLQRKVEELEGKLSSSSSKGCGERKAIYSAIKESDPMSGVIEAFLYLHKNKITVPKSLEGIRNVTPIKGIHSLHIRLKDSKSATRNILYKEDESDRCIESHNMTQQSEQPEVLIKKQRMEEDNENMTGFNNSVHNLFAKTQNVKESNEHVSSKREIANTVIKEESASKPTTFLKPSLAKKKKILKF